MARRTPSESPPSAAVARGGGTGHSASPQGRASTSRGDDGIAARRLAARGAEVTIDGRAVGVTPLTIDDLAPGEHRVVLQIPGFNLWATTAQVKAGSRTRVAASLERVQ